MKSSTQPDSDVLAATIRRTLRVLGAQPLHASDPTTTLHAARLVFERLRRAGIPTQWIEVDQAPLVVAGSGPVALSAYMDDSHPLAADHSGRPLEFDEGTVRGPGIERKAGLVSALSILLTSPELSDTITLIVETDRLAGSLALESWIAATSPRFDRVAWEVTDLPLVPPVLVRAATGTLSVDVTLKSTRQNVEPVYGTVIPDIGFALAALVASLKTPDEEVQIDGFYDTISTPDAAEYDALVDAAPGISDWLRRIAGDERNLSTTHMTLGLFIAPGVIVRDLAVSTQPNYLPDSASVSLDFVLLPGQSPERVLDELSRRASDSPFSVNVRPRLVRPPVSPPPKLLSDQTFETIPIAPGPSPAALFRAAGAPGIGYAVVGRSAGREERGIRLDEVENASRFLLRLVEALSHGRVSG